eukprot:TRINITY_DN3483_c0_g1_i1.p1 TRINITY_DN3483_c0_g1~~TRINITY_DN3483_c0_g1_i1.p1  ORF type:complete len:207 (-),score=22.53 TRINITY_DN3483_c0_g1_i1:145-765(-)
MLWLAAATALPPSVISAHLSSLRPYRIWLALDGVLSKPAGHVDDCVALFSAETSEIFSKAGSPLSHARCYWISSGFLELGLPSIVELPQATLLCVDAPLFTPSCAVLANLPPPPADHLNAATTPLPMLKSPGPLHDETKVVVVAVVAVAFGSVLVLALASIWRCRQQARYILPLRHTQTFFNPHAPLGLSWMVARPRQTLPVSVLS